MTYIIEWEKRTEHRFLKLPDDVRARVLNAIAALANDPRPPGCKKLTGTLDLWRIRVGDYRVVYRIEDDKLLVVIVRAGHRSDVYE